MGDERVPGFPVSAHDRDPGRRHPGPQEDGHQGQRRVRGGFRGFHHDRVAGQQRRAELVGDEVERVVERGDRRDDAEGFADEPAALARAPVAVGELEHLAAQDSGRRRRQAQGFGAAPHFLFGLDDGLAAFGVDDPGQPGGLVPHEPGGLVQGLPPLPQRPRFGNRAGRGADGGVDVGRVVARDPADGRAVVRVGHRRGEPGRLPPARDQRPARQAERRGHRGRGGHEIASSTRAPPPISGRNQGRPKCPGTGGNRASPQMLASASPDMKRAIFWPMYVAICTPCPL